MGKELKMWTIVRVFRNGMKEFWTGPVTLNWSSQIQKAFRFKKEMRTDFTPEEVLVMFDRQPSRTLNQEYYWHYQGDPLPEHSRAWEADRKKWIIVSYDPNRLIEYFYYRGNPDGFGATSGWKRHPSDARPFSTLMAQTYSPEAVIEMYGGILAKGSETEIYYWEEVVRQPDDPYKIASQALDDFVDRYSTMTPREPEPEFAEWFRKLTDLCAKALRNRSSFKITSTLSSISLIYFYCEDAELAKMLEVWGKVELHGDDNIYRLDVNPMWRYSDVLDIFKQYEKGEKEFF